MQQRTEFAPFVMGRFNPALYGKTTDKHRRKETKNPIAEILVRLQSCLELPTLSLPCMFGPDA
jgi:hypothetical protein